jgi:hypothetical protein
MTTTLQAIDYVQAGAQVLTDYDPDWSRRINLDTLNIHDPVNCVIGQVLGSFYMGINALNYRDAMDPWVTTQQAAQWALEHALDCAEEDAALLNTLWRTKVEAARRVLVAAA